MIGTMKAKNNLQGLINNSGSLTGSFALYLIPPSPYSGSYAFTPSEDEQTIRTKNKSLLENITIEPIPSEYIVPSGTYSIIENGEYGISEYASVDVSVPQGALNPQEKSVTISAAGTLEIEPDEGHDALSKVITNTPSASYTHGYQTEYDDAHWRITPNVQFSQAGWVNTGISYNSPIPFNAVPSGTVVTPSTASQNIGGANYMMQSAITVSPIPSEYIIPSGTYSISENATYDITAYASVEVSVSGGGGNLYDGSVTIDTYGTSVFSPSVGYDGFSTFTVETPSATKTTTLSGSFYTENDSRKWAAIANESFLGNGFWVQQSFSHIVQRYRAVPSGIVLDPSTSSQTIGGANYMMEGSVIFNSMPTVVWGAPSLSEYISGDMLTLELSYPSFSNGYIDDLAPFYIDLELQSRTVTPTEASRTVTPTNYSYYLSEVTVEGIPSNYVGTAIPYNSSSDLYGEHEEGWYTVHTPSGYYSSSARYSVTTAVGSGSISYVQSTGLITATFTTSSAGYTPTGTSTVTKKIGVAHATISANGTYYAIDDDNDAWTGVTVSVNSSAPALQSKSVSYNPSSSSVLDTVTADNGYDGLSEVAIEVSPIPSDYVGSGIPRRSSSDLTPAEDYNIKAPSGYYASNAFIQMPTNPHNAPSVSINNSGLITATHYQIVDTIVTGSATTSNTMQLPSKSSSDLTVSGSTVTAPSGYYASSATATVSIPTPSLQTVAKTYNPSTSAITETISASAGYDGLEEVDITITALTDGNNLEYGLTDGTLPIVGVAKVGQAEI